ncbi:MAG: redoxin domain-containing protein [Proteobacteria bacterium]|nr:redoxin domain-containing protein [Pseudomonadota bacterium]
MGIRKKLFGIASDTLRPAALLGAGSEAPAFDLRAHDGSRVSSADLADKNHYVLIFYPGDDTPGCTKQLHDFDRMREQFAAEDCLIFGVNAADEASHRSFVEGQCYSLPLLVDEGRKLAVAYRTARPGVPATFRSVFYIDKKGIVRTAMKDAPDPQAVLSMVKRQNETGTKGTGRKGRRLAPLVSGYGLGKLQENNPATVVLDIRDEADWKHGHIRGAINIPIDHLMDRLDQMPGHETPLVVACDQGLRAPGAAKLLHDAGFRKLFSLQDGMEAYKGELEAG